MTEFVIANDCCVCKDQFLSGEIIIAIGKPHHCLVHKRCAYIYPYNKGWPHPKPLNDYQFYTQIVESKLNLERSNFLRSSSNASTNSSSIGNSISPKERIS